MAIVKELQTKVKAGPGEIQVKLETITPVMAKLMLALGNHRDRPLSKIRVKNLAAAIQRGEWRTNTDCIGFDVKGRRINGQHRLTAIVEANMAVPVLVGYKFPEEVFMTTDTGAKRTAADLAAMVGLHKNYIAVGAAINLLWRYQRSTVHKPDIQATNTQIHGMLLENQGIEHSAVVGRTMGPILTPGIATFCHFIFSRLNMADTQVFFDRLRSGAHLSEGSPILVLRNRLAAERAAKASLPPHETVALVIKAWNFYRRGRKIKNLVWQKRQGEAFPKAI